MKFRRFAAMLLCLCLAAAMVPAGATAAEVTPAAAVEAIDTGLAESIGEQISSFASSINQTDAAHEAALRMAAHGMTKGGASLEVGKSHPLTATIFNSEMMKECLTRICTEAIRRMYRTGHGSMPYLSGSCNWYGYANSSYSMYPYRTADYAYAGRETILISCKEYTGKINGYDESLEWMAGSTGLKMSIEYVKTSGENKVYKVTAAVNDCFDFSNANSSLFKDLISGIGAILFREFNWKSSVSFELTVPYTCDHSTGAYRWTYDAENITMTADAADGYLVNQATQVPYPTSSGKVYYYFSLEDTVRLYHNKPWVLEYDIKKAGSFVFAPTETVGIEAPCLYNYSRKYLFIWDMEQIQVSDAIVKQYELKSDKQKIRHYYGMCLTDLFKYSSNKLYSIRLENQVNADGSNMIYLTMRNLDTGETVVDRLPMDDYYRYDTWVKETALQSTQNSGVSGMDLYINYIGNKTSRFSAGEFELRIWENGDGGAEGSFYRKVSVTQPTCASQGYTTYVCDVCGHTKKSDYTPTSAHTWGPWEVVRAATASQTGLRRHSCTVCGAAEDEEIPMLEVDYGDINADSKINTLDLILLRQYLAGWDVSTDPRGIDINADTQVNTLDLILLRQYLAGWGVPLGPQNT